MSVVKKLVFVMALALSASAIAQVDPALRAALQDAERMPVIVVFDFGQAFGGDMAVPTLDNVDARLARQAVVLERALGRTIDELSTPVGVEASRLRRTYQSVAMVAMILTESEIDALIADPDVASIQLDQLSAPTSNGTIPLIGADDLHNAGLTGAGVATAILDTGVDHEHPMFAGRIVESICFSTNNAGFSATSFCPGGVEEDLITEDAGDDCPFTGDSETPVSGCGHGTHVAGIAAGGEFFDPSTGNTLIGVAPGADVVAVQVFSRFTTQCGGFGLPSPCTLSFSSDQIAALDWLFVNRVALNLASANMSLGGGNNTGFCNSDSRFAVINNLRNAGVATAIASGNDGFNNAVGAPGCIEPAITVGATTDADVVASFSNSATMVDLLAPGVNINSAAPTIDDTLPGRARSISGTSMATPHVAGAFALLKSIHPNASVDTIENALKNTGVPITESPSGLVRPRIQVDLANGAIDSTNPQVNSIERFSPIAELTNEDVVIWRVTFSEPVVNVTSDDFLVSGTTGTVSADNVASNITDVTVLGGDMATVSGVIALGFASGQDIQDPSGNPLAPTTPTGANQTYTLDHTVPVLQAITRNSPASEQTDEDLLIFAIDFSEAVSNATVDDFIITGTTATGVLDGSDSNYEMVVSGGDLANLTGTVGLDLAPSQNITDTVGNALGSAEPDIDETYSVVNTATVGGEVTGLLGSGLVLQNQGGDDRAINGNGPYVFSTPVNTGQTYDVSVSSSPTGPSQTCTVSNETGPVTGPDIENVDVSCETNQFTVGGSVVGLLGSGLLLTNNGGDTLSVNDNGTFTFSTAIVSGGSYDVEIASDPTGPEQRCELNGESGLVGDGPVESVEVVCRSVVDLAIAKFSDLDFLEPEGNSITYEIAVTNNSSVTVVNARVIDTVPPELGNVGWSCTAPAGSSCASEGFDSLDELVTLGPNATVVFFLSADVQPNISTLINTVAVAAPALVIEDDLSNNVATDQVGTVDIFADRFED